MEGYGELSRQGWMKTNLSKINKLNKWSEKYFVLEGPVLHFYLKNTDTEPKGSIILHDVCKVSDIRLESTRKQKQFIFSVTWSVENEVDDRDEAINPTDINQTPSEHTLEKEKLSPRRLLGRRKNKEEQKRSGKSFNGSKVAAFTLGGVVAGAFTAGAGLIAGMLVMGAVGTAMNQTNNDRERQMLLSCETFHDAELWVQAIETQLKIAENSGNPLPLGEKNNSYTLPSELHVEKVQDWITSSRWRVWSIQDGLRLFEQSNYEDFSKNNSLASNFQNGFDDGPPTLRVNVNVTGCAVDVFLAIVNLPPACRTGSIKGIRVIESINNYTDVVHIVLDPVFLYPSWTAPRDFCLMRYWKHNDSDGSYIVCLNSTIHEDCPLLSGEGCWLFCFVSISIPVFTLFSGLSS